MSGAHLGWATGVLAGAVTPFDEELPHRRRGRFVTMSRGWVAPAWRRSWSLPTPAKAST